MWERYFSVLFIVNTVVGIMGVLIGMTVDSKFLWFPPINFLSAWAAVWALENLCGD